MSAPKPPDPRQWSEAERWLARVDDDLRAAEALLALAAPATGTAAFHCQQAAEKMAKAVLIAARQPPPRLHDIEELGRRIRPHHLAIGEAFEALGGLTRWYVSARYPGTGVDVGTTVDHVHDVLARVRVLRRQIDGLKPAAASENGRP